MEIRAIQALRGSCARAVFLSLLVLASPISAAPGSDGIDLRVKKGPGTGEVTLTWTGGLPDYEVFRSTSPQDTTDPINSLGQTSGSSWSDTPPAGDLFFYLVQQVVCVPAPPEICDGIDNDCNPSTPDGADEPQLGAPCDGADGDLCKEGAIVCSAGSLSCSDATGTTVDLCNGADDDCDPGSADGSEDPNIGLPCDGADGDLCVEGVRTCSAGVLACSDTTGTTVELCNSIDDDCDGLFNEGFVQNDNPVCGGATVLGSVSGDSSSSALTAGTYSEKWYRVTVREDSSSTRNVTATIQLTSPFGVDFDLFVYCASCGGFLAGQSTVRSLGGHTDTVGVRMDDDIFGGDDTFDVLIEVRFVNSSTCANWSLNVTGNTSVNAPTCF